MSENFDEEEVMIFTERTPGHALTREIVVTKWGEDDDVIIEDNWDQFFALSPEFRRALVRFLTFPEDDPDYEGEDRIFRLG